MSKRIRDYVYGETPVQEWCSLDYAAFKVGVPATELRRSAQFGHIKSHNVNGVIAVELTEVRRFFAL